MSAMGSHITGVSIVCSAVCSDQRKHQSSASLTFVRGIHRWPVDSTHKGSVTRKVLLFDDIIMNKVAAASWVSTVHPTMVMYISFMGTPVYLQALQLRLAPSLSKCQAITRTNVDQITWRCISSLCRNELKIWIMLFMICVPSIALIHKSSGWERSP